MGIRRWLVQLGILKAKSSIIFLGLANSGKTSIVNKLMRSDMQEVVPTVGFSVEKMPFGHCHLTVMDMSGQEKYSDLWELQFQDVQGVVFVVDASCKEELPRAQQAFHKVASQPDVQSDKLWWPMPWELLS